MAVTVECGPAPLAVTTSAGVSAAIAARARARASEWGVPWIPRHDQRLEELLAKVAGALIVFRGDGVVLRDRDGEVRWSAGMAHLRLKTLEDGGSDTLVDVAALKPGEAVLDCTLGLGQDALVAARAVGPGGRVVAIEKSLPLFALVSEGLQTRLPDPSSAQVQTVHADAAAHLRTVSDRAFDVVLFDPMFSRPRKSQAAFDMLRRHAESAPLTQEMVRDAQRVARRAVVVKGSRHSDDLKRLGLRALERSRYADVVWATVPALGT